MLVTERLAETGPLAEHTAGLDELEAALADFTPEAVEAACGIDAATIRALAHDLAAAPTAAVYGRIGTCTQEFGTLASWLVDVVNLLSGNLDRVGGAMFAKGAVGQPSTKGAPGSGRGFRMGRVVSRVAHRPESLGEFPVTALPEEIETPGEGQVRAWVTVAGNPVSSNPNSERLDAALASLDFMVAVDPYVNETTRHADVILPPPSALEKSHYDLALLNFAVHNVANYSPPVVDKPADQPEEWEILLRLAAWCRVPHRLGCRRDGRADREGVRRVRRPRRTRKVYERDPDELMSMTDGRRGPERLLDIMLRTGPYGDGFGARPDGISLATLEANPHGVDLGPLEPGRVPDLLRTPSGRSRRSPSRCEPTSSGCERASTATTTSRWCSSGGDTSGRTTRGCTTCACS